MRCCEQCGANYDGAYAHRCDKANVASKGKQVCIDCNLNLFASLKEVRASLLKELEAIPEGVYSQQEARREPKTRWLITGRYSVQP
jgi:hypothetical protein